MLKVRIIPTMLFNGISLIKTIKFGEHRTLGNPIQIARVYNSRDVDELIFIDITATKNNRSINFDIIKNISKECFMPLSIGGGIHSIEDINNLLKSGADKIVINSEALKNPSFIKESSKIFGSQCIIVSIDVKKINDEYFVFSDNGTINTGKTLIEWALDVEKLGAGEIYLTSIDNDGKMEGFDINIYKILLNKIKIPLIASGGAGKISDFLKLFKETDVSAASAASIFHYTHVTPNNIKELLNENNIPVRLIK